jgi:xanthosine utilization system XapX-like protein
MKLGFKNIISLTVGVLGVTYFGEKIVSTVKDITAKDEPQAVEVSAPVTEEAPAEQAE